LVESAEESGAIESDEKELITSVFEFTDTVAREVMTPRTDLDAVPVDTDPKELVEIIQRTGHSRIPLYEGTDDAIVGIVHAKDLLLAMVNYKPVTLRKLMRPAIFVNETKSLHDLLRDMRASRSQLAVVQDEFGGTAGIVTIEDVIEELVGEIQDEYDQEEPAVAEAGAGYLVEGKTHIDDVNAEIGSRFNSEDFDTIGGYVFGIFGRQPKLGEMIEAEHFRFTVAETDGKRILRLRVEPFDANAADDAA
ncbi:HlyC/CorC family transporter, partial [bacterium]